MRVAGGLPRRRRLLECLRVPPAQEETVQHDVDLVGAHRDDLPDLRSRASSGPRPAGNAAGDARHLHAGALQLLDRDRHELRVDADRGHRRDGRVGRVGRTAFAHIATTLPGVSAPSSVVRSMHRIARSSARSFESLLIERLASDAARSSSPTASTAGTRATSRGASFARATGPADRLDVSCRGHAPASWLGTRPW